MIVDSMTFPEVIEEVRKDVAEDIEPRVCRGEFGLARKYETWMKRNGQRNKFQLFKPHKIKSARNNTYLFIPWCEGLGEQISFDIFAVVRYKGYPYIMTRINDAGRVFCFSKHYFDRYAERKEGQTGKEITPEYMGEVSIRMGNQFPSFIPDSRYPDSFFAVNKEGISLGTDYSEHNYSVFNTFISFEMLQGKQLALAEKMKQIGKIMEEVEFNKRKFPKKNNEPLREKAMDILKEIDETILDDYLEEIGQ